ncbi:MAG: helix-hairpin-helix domain-containing protein [Phycisphaerales bacterium]|nr:helix-hairpin-helix domain-containing protein [Phycisphaerales bacterium]
MTSTPQLPTPPTSTNTFTRSHRIAFAILTSLLFVFLLVQYLRRPVPLDERVMMQTPFTLPSRVDPNTATLQELTRIPHLAEGLAKKIIDYRTARLPLTSDGIVFRQPVDLTHVSGLGQKTLDLLLAYLEFPEEPEESNNEIRNSNDESNSNVQTFK